MQLGIFKISMYSLLAIMVFIIAAILTMIGIVVCWEGIYSVYSFDRMIAALIKCSVFIGTVWVIALSIVCIAGYYEKYSSFEEYKRRTDEILAEVEELKKELASRAEQERELSKEAKEHIMAVLNNVNKDDRPTDADENTITKVIVES